MKRKLLIGLSVVATAFATVLSTSACFFCMYQPEEPKSLREE